MTFTATYNDDLSRVQLTFSGAPATADHAIIERSTNGVTWTTVRGGDSVAITDGSGKLDDYEFAAGVENRYRVSYVDTGPITGVGYGTPAIGNNTSLTPGLPDGLETGDLMLLFTSIRNTDGYPDAIEGWSVVSDLGNAGVYARRYQAGDEAPTVTFSGGVSGADTIAIIGAWRNASEVPHVVNTRITDTPTQNIPTPTLHITVPATLDVFFGWKQDAWTDIIDVFDTTEVVSVVGDGAGEVITYTVQGPTDVISFDVGAWEVTGGSPAISKVASHAFGKAPWLRQETVSITPQPTGIWLKNPRRANYNTQVTVIDFSSITRPARVGVFDVIGRSLPVAVTDVRGGRQLTLTVTTKDLSAAEDLEARLAQGGPIFLQTPSPDCPVPSGYFVVGDVTIDKTSKRTVRRIFDLPLTEVDAPASTIYSQTATWADIVAAYTSWADLMAHEPTWSDVVDYVAPASNIIVP